MLFSDWLILVFGRSNCYFTREIGSIIFPRCSHRWRRSTQQIRKGRRMKSGKDEGKQIEPPLFPRIRLTSAEKGGPRAPPRNKMALCQQLTLSSPKFTPSSTSPSTALSLSSSSSSFVPSASSNHDGSSYRRSIFSSYHSIPGSTYLGARRIDPHNSGGINLNASRTTVRPEAEIKNHQTLCHKGADSHRFIPPSVTNSRTTCVKNLVPLDGDDFLVPLFTELSDGEPKLKQEKLASSSTRKRSALAMEDRDFKKSTSKEISPDAVVKLIGQKRFWQARRTLEQQQRVFAQQVYELHRLIMVQRLLAASPELLLEDNYYSSKLKMSEPLTTSLVAKPRLDPIPRKSAAGNGAAKRISSAQNNNNKSICSKPIPLIYPPLSTQTTDPSSWCLNPPPGNQWLVPVRSPSEGLVYKPYTGPYPPSAGLLAPIIGAPISLSTHPFSVPEAGGIVPGTIGTPTYISPYVVPMIKPSSTISSVQQAIPLVKAAPISNSTTSFSTIPYKPSSRKGVISAPMLLGSSSGCSSSSDRAHAGDELQLFPTAPTPEVSGNKSSGDEGVKVIKVVPHNPKLASESAARIFRSIQEERNQGSGCQID